MDVTRDTKKSVTLTIGQLSEVSDCIRMAQMRCKHERDFWMRLSLEKGSDGTPKYKNAQRNIEYLDEKISEFKEIRRVLDGDTICKAERA